MSWLAEDKTKTFGRKVSGHGTSSTFGALGVGGGSAPFSITSFEDTEQTDDNPWATQKGGSSGRQRAVSSDQVHQGLKNRDMNQPFGGDNKSDKTSVIVDRGKPAISKRKNSNQENDQKKKRGVRERSGSPTRQGGSQATQLGIGIVDDAPVDIFAPLSEPSVPIRRGKKNDAFDALALGTEEDIAYLQQSLQSHGATRGPAFLVAVDTPEHYNQEQSANFKAFLQSLGFTERLVGENVVLRLSATKVNDLKRMLGTYRGGIFGSVAHSLPGSPLDSPSPSVSSRSSSASFSETFPPSGGKAVSSTRIRSASASDADRGLDAIPMTRTRSLRSNSNTEPITSFGRKPLSIITEGKAAELNLDAPDVPLSSGSRLKRQASRFPPRAGAMGVFDRAESPAGFSPRDSPRFFPEPGDTPQSTTGSSSGRRADFPDEVYPQLGVGLEDLALSRASVEGSVNFEAEAGDFQIDVNTVTMDRDSIAVGGDGSHLEHMQQQTNENDIHSDGSTILDTDDEEDDAGLFDPDARNAPIDSLPEMHDYVAHGTSPDTAPVHVQHSPLTFTNALSHSTSSDFISRPQPNYAQDPVSNLRSISEGVTFDTRVSEHDISEERCNSWVGHEHSGDSDTLGALRPGSRGIADVNDMSDPDHSGEGVEFASFLPNRERSSGAGLGTPGSPVYAAVWGALRRESGGSTDSSSKGVTGRPDRDSQESMGSFGVSGGGHLAPGRSGTRGSNKHRSAAQERKMLRRSVTMPSMRNRPNLHPGQQTPCGPSGSANKSQATPGKFNTPQPRADVVTVSGCGEIDWGVSYGAPEESIQNLINRLVQRHGSMVSRPGLYRSQSASNMDQSVGLSHFDEHDRMTSQDSNTSSSGSLGIRLKRSESLSDRDPSWANRDRSSSENVDLLQPALPVAFNSSPGNLVFSYPNLNPSATSTSMATSPFVQAQPTRENSTELSSGSVRGKSMICNDGNTQVHASPPVNGTAPANFSKIELARRTYERNSATTLGSLSSFPSDGNFRSISSVNAPVNASAAESHSHVSTGPRRSRRVEQSLAKWRRQSMMPTGGDTRGANRRGMNMGLDSLTTIAPPTSAMALSVLESSVTDGSEDEEEVDTSMSPAVKTKCSTRRRRRISAETSHRRIGMDDSVSDEERCFKQDENINCDTAELLPDADAHRHPHVDGLTARTFRGIVVGGNYQQCFDDCAPVVASSKGNRVTSVSFAADRSLLLRLYLPRHGSHGGSGGATYAAVDLGQNWYWMRAAPNGYLVFRDVVALPMQPKHLFYYLPHHPNEWVHDSNDSTMNEGGHGDVAFVEGDIRNIVNNSGPAHDIHESGQVSWSGDFLSATFSSDRIDAPSPIEAHNSSHVDAHHTPGAAPHEEMISALGQDQNQMDLSLSNVGEYEGGDINTVLYVDAADWNQPSIVSCVLEFLLGDTTSVHHVGIRGCGRQTRRTTNQQRIDEDVTSYRKVSKAWALGSYRLLARQVASCYSAPLMPPAKWIKFANKYGTWGRFLAMGACKRVYCVQNPSGLLEAVSVMDVQDLRSRNMDGAVSKEIEISLACSSIASLNVCPNLVHVHSLFRSKCPVPSTLWSSTTAPPPPPQTHLLDMDGGTDSHGNNYTTGNALGLRPPQQSEQGLYQYIRMEYCSGGDLEEYCRSRVTVPAVTIRSMMFQMCFALYSCREQLNLRHFDIKLLNFLVTSGSTLMPPDFAAMQARRSYSPFESFREPSEMVLDMCVGFGSNVFCLSLQGHESDTLVKLADFGTSVVGAGGLGDPISVQQFTTLENTPPEFLLLGSMARQALSADTFPLGLSYLHLLTGSEPYEVLLEDVFCPRYLLKQLWQVWSPRDDIDSPYHVIRDVVRTCRLDADDEHASQGYDGAILCHTLYRYFVLFGPPKGSECDLYEDSPAWKVIATILGFDAENSSAAMRTRRSRLITESSEDVLEARNTFNAHRATWSWEFGSHPIMKQVRQRLAEMGKGAARLLKRLTHFDPSHRCTMQEALSSPAFFPLIDNTRGGSRSSSVGYGHLQQGSSESSRASSYSARSSPRTLSRNGHSSNYEVRFMHYHREVDEGGTEVLPFV